MSAVLARVARCPIPEREVPCTVSPSSLRRSFVAFLIVIAASTALVPGGSKARPHRPDSTASVAGDAWRAVDDLGPTTTSTTEPPTTTTEPPRVARPQYVGPPSTGECANPVISEQTARAESGCRWDAYNPTGCGGRGCLGFYQLDAGHFAAVSPWNSNVSGSCHGIDPSTREGQTECASRLGPGAWG